MIPLASESVALDASGNGRVTFTAPAWRRWRIARTTVATNPAVGGVTAQCYLYVGHVMPGNQRDATYNGRRNSSDVPITLEPGETLTVVWLGGTVGHIASAVIEGDDVAV